MIRIISREWLVSTLSSAAAVALLASFGAPVPPVPLVRRRRRFGRRSAEIRIRTAR